MPEKKTTVDTLADLIENEMNGPLVIPDDPASRLHRAPRTAPDDVTTADDRIAKFWKRYPQGRLATAVDTSISSTGADIYTVTALVYKNADSETPDSSAHATRSTADPDEITAQFPQETAETAALSRAIRYLGSLAIPRKKS